MLRHLRDIEPAGPAVTVPSRFYQCHCLSTYTLQSCPIVDEPIADRQQRPSVTSITKRWDSIRQELSEIHIVNFRQCNSAGHILKLHDRGSPQGPGRLYMSIQADRCAGIHRSFGIHRAAA